MVQGTGAKFWTTTSSMRVELRFRLKTSLEP